MTIQCSKCGAPAIYLRRYTAEALCKDCLVKTTTRRVVRVINKRKMFQETDRILVAISGGKDSAVLLSILNCIEMGFPKSEIIPLTIDEGIKGYRDKALDAARTLTTSLGLKLMVKSFKEYFGYTLDEIALQRRPDGSGACTYCGVLRRRALNSAAKEIDADVVASGHNMDDEAQTVIMNVIRGDSKRIGMTHRLRTHVVEGLVSRVKPLIGLSERDIVAYAHHLELPYHDIPCPYYLEAMRNDLRTFLNDMEHKRPGTLLATLNSGEMIADAFNRVPATMVFNHCEKCGEPTPRRVCKTCMLLDELG